MQSLFRADDAPRGDPLYGLGEAHNAGQEPTGAGLVDIAAARKYKAELGVLGENAHVHGEGHGDPDPHGGAVYGGKDGFAHGVNAQGVGAAGVPGVVETCFRKIEGLVNGEIKTGAIGGPFPTLRACEDHHAHVVITVGGIQGEVDFLTHLAIVGIHVFGTVQGDGTDALPHLVQDGIIGHGRSAPSSN